MTPPVASPRSVLPDEITASALDRLSSVRISMFIVLVTLFSLPFWWLAHTTNSGRYTALLMWCPCAAAVVTLKATGGSLGDLGWNGSRMRWLVMAWALTVVCICGAYAALYPAGIITLPAPGFLHDVGDALGFPRAPAWMLVLAYAGMASTVGLMNGVGRALGEELGWRGLLVPVACRRFGFRVGAPLTGLVWALWHLPLILGRTYTGTEGGHTSVIAIINFMALVIGISIPYAWFRLKSGSVWPSTVMHGTHNAMRDFVASLTVGTTATSAIWLGETGYALAVTGICVGVLFIVLGLREFAAARSSF